MPSWLWPVQDSMIPGLNVQFQNCIGITVCVPAVGKGVDWGPFCRLWRKVFQWLPGVVSHSSWLIPGQRICSSCLDHFHTAL